MTKEEALRKIKTWNLYPDDMEVLTVLVPELAESEDERIRKAIVETIKQCPDTFLNPKNRDNMLAYLEKQKEQKPAEWSGEDDALLREIVSFFKDGTAKLQHDLDLYAGFLEKKFKSLRPQPHWKPSEEQMAMLRAVLNDSNNMASESANLALKSLYNDLKKL